MLRRPFLTCLLLLCTGCAANPSINVLGAYFPDWMFCIVGAMAATALLHVFLRASGHLHLLGQRTMPLIHLATSTVLALAAWLIFFKN